MGGIADSIFGGDDASDAAKDAADTAAQAQREALEYLKEREAIPQQFREGALKRLAGMYDLPGGVGSHQGIISKAVGSPLYKQIMRGLIPGEEAILRNAAATGGLRSGNVQDALAEHAIDLETEALMRSYYDKLGGMQNLANLPSNTSQIASTMAGIGGTEAAGITAGAQAKQDAMSNFLNTGLGIAGLFF